MARRLLPIGFQSFRKVRSRDCYYVDKTGYALRVVQEGEYYLLSRPPSFGKSLFLDTIKELFARSRELFQALQAYDRWDWTVRHPVVRLSFGGGKYYERGGLHAKLMAQLGRIERKTQSERYSEPAADRLQDLLEGLHDRTGERVVLLVDKYDKPILDALEFEEVAGDNRDYLRGFYSVIKDCADHVRFCFITGVSKFSKVSLFSGLNNLRDITLNPAYSAICGYTERDVDEIFAPELPGLDRERIREWYNGYSWGGEEKVYNPVDLLHLFADRKFKPWWYGTGTPTILIRMLVERGVRATALDGMLATEDLLSSFDVDAIETEALLFQSGYLTLAGKVVRGGVECCRLGYPNKEVRQSLNLSLVDLLEGTKSERKKHSIELGELLEAADFAGLEGWLHARIAGMPYQWHTGNKMADYEGFYASLCYSFCAGLGLDVTVEESSSRRRSDMVVRGFGRVFVFEFKVVDRPGSGGAMAQLKDRRYADKYRHRGEPLHLVAVEFSKKDRNVVSVEAELA